MISVTIATSNFRFLYKLNEILSDIKEIKTNHILPNETIPFNTDLVITTEIEKKKINYEKIFVPKAFNHYYLFSNIHLLSSGKNYYEEIIIGIDPGKTTGFAVLAERKIILGNTEVYTVVDAVKEVIAVFFNIETAKLTIKIGEGGGTIKNELVERLDEIFHDKIQIKIVNEDFTSQKKMSYLDKKLPKNIQSAILIALKET